MAPPRNAEPMTLHSFINREVLLPSDAGARGPATPHVLYLRVQGLDGRGGHEHWPHEQYAAVSGTWEIIDPATGRLFPFQREYILPYMIIHTPSSACCRIGHGQGLQEDYDDILRVFCTMLDSGVRFEDSVPERVQERLRWKQPDGYGVFLPRAPAWNRQPPPWAGQSGSGRAPQLLHVYGPTIKVRHDPIRSVVTSVHHALTTISGWIPVSLLPHLGSTEIQLALYYAAATGVTRNVYKAVKLGASVDYPDPDGRTALHAALCNRRHAAAQALLVIGASACVSTGAGWTVLMSAAKHGYAELAAQMLDAGAELESRTQGGQSALIVATAFGRSECARRSSFREVQTSTRMWMSSVTRQLYLLAETVMQQRLNYCLIEALSRPVKP